MYNLKIIIFSLIIGIAATQSCKRNDIKPKQKDRILTINLGAPHTRVMGEKIDNILTGTPNVSFKWNNGDKIKTVISQQGKTSIKQEVELKDFSEDGKYARLLIKIPDTWDTNKKITVYGVHGNAVDLNANNPNTAIITNISDLNDIGQTAIGFKAVLEAGKTNISTAFKHLFALVAIRIQNGTSGEYTFPSGDVKLIASEDWVYNSGSYNLDDNTLSGTEPSRTLKFFTPSPEKIGGDEIIELWGIMLPTGVSPSIDLHVGTEKKNTISATRKTGGGDLMAGKTYYFSAKTSGNNINFIKSSELVDFYLPDFTASGDEVVSSRDNNPNLVKIFKLSGGDIIFTLTTKKGIPAMEPLTSIDDTDMKLNMTNEAEKTATYKLSFKDISSDSKNKVYFKVYNKSKGDGVSFRKFTLKRNSMAIEYFAEYNVSKTPGVFADSHDNDKSGYYNWYEATGTTDPTHNPNGIKACPEGYHLPTRDEYEVFIRQPNNFDFNGSNYPVNEWNITIRGVTKTYKSYFSGDKSIFTVYGIRFENASETNKNRVASRTQFYNSRQGANLTNACVKVTHRYLGNSSKTLIANNVKEDNYWYSNNENDATYILPLAGEANGNNRGKHYYYWCANSSGNTAMLLSSSNDNRPVSADTWQSKSNRYAVRCIADN